MSSGVDDDVFVTKVYIPDTRTHQLLSVIKPEPQEYSLTDNRSGNEINEKLSNPHRKILPAVSVPAGATPPTFSGPTYSAADVHPSHNASSVANHGVPYGTTNQNTCGPPVAQQTVPSPGVSTATLYSRSSVALSNLTAITPFLVSNFVPSDMRKPSEPLNSSNVLPRLVNSSAQSTFGLLNPSHFAEPPSYTPQSQPHPVSHTVVPSTSQRLSLFTHLVTRGVCPTSTAVANPPVTTPPASTHTNLGLPPGFTGAAGNLWSIRPRLSNPSSQTTWQSNTLSCVPNLLPKPIPSGSCPVLFPSQSSIRGTGLNTGTSVSITHRNHLDHTTMAGVAQGHPSTQLHNSQRVNQVMSETVRHVASDTFHSAISTTSISQVRLLSTGSLQSFLNKAQSVETNTPPTIASSPSVSGVAVDSDRLVWGRIMRLPEGDVHFPGLGRLFFSSPQSVLRQIQRIASSEDSLTLQLPACTVDFEPAVEFQMNNWLRSTSTVFGSRKGFHVCLCCHQAFTSRALYESHMRRPIARMLYRCHLCRDSGADHHFLPHTTNSTSNSVSDIAPNSMVRISVPGSGLENLDHTEPSRGIDTHSPYCTVLPGGIIKAPNHCAIYSHMVCMHPNRASSWDLLPSLLTICPLAESAWPVPSFKLDRYLGCSGFSNVGTAAIPVTGILKPDGDHSSNTTNSTPSVTSRPPNPILNPKVSEESGSLGNGAHNNLTGPLTTANSDQEGFCKTHGGAADIFVSAEPLDQATFYQPGLELVELWRDLERAVSESVSHQSLRFLTPNHRNVNGSLSLPSVSSNSKGNSPDSPWKTSIPTESGGGSVPDQPLFHSAPDFRCTFSQLPTLDSPLAQTILFCAGTTLWKSHLFLTSWCQQILPTDDLVNGSCAPILLADEAENTRDSNPNKSTTNKSGSSATGDVSLTDCTDFALAPAPSPAELVRALHQPDCCWPNCRESTCPSLESDVDAREQQSATRLIPRKDFSPGLLRCLMCNFSTNNSQELQLHLTGAQPFTLTKCALCGQAVCIRQPNLCAVKAHLFLHLGCFLMCPQCGFTPAAHLSPDAAELCLRIHLRFVCFHYNLLQVYLCNRCQGRGKAFHSLTSLCQHYFERHTTRVYACLWCARQVTEQHKTMNTKIECPLNNESLDERATNSVEFDSSKSTETCTSKSLAPDCAVTRSEKPIFSHSTVRELLLHMRTSHRNALAIPTSMSSSVTSCISQNAITAVTTACNGDPVGHQRSASSPTASQPSESQGDEPETDGGSTPLQIGEQISANSIGSSDKYVRSGSGDVSVSLHSRNSPSPICLVPGVDFTFGYKCSECNQVFDQRDGFSQHFRTTHPWSYSTVCCYRCFGSCKRLSYKLDEFCQHATRCPNSRRMFSRTFGGTTNYSGIQSHDYPKSDGTGPTGNPLCFCAYCGIGARRLEGSTLTTETSALPDSPKNSPTELVIDEHRDTFTAIQIPQRVCTAPAATPSSGNASGPVYESIYFHDLRSLWTHESECHGFENSSPIACPWCGSRLSCDKRSDLKWTTQHLRSHLRKHRLARWIDDRKKRWKTMFDDLSHCFCGSALLDSPLALASHCSIHLIASNPLVRHSTSQTQTEVVSSIDHASKSVAIPNGERSDGSVDCFTDYERSSARPSNTSSTGPVHAMHSVPRMKFILRPNSSAHIPCSIEVYRHLRFAEFPTLDRYLDEACEELCTFFTCPMCQTDLSTRWALTEHAFVEHWGVLCYICCVYIAADDPYSCNTERNTNDILPPSGTLPKPQPGMSSPSKEATHSFVTSTVTTHPNTISYRKAEEMKFTIVENFWTHVYRCLNERRQAICRARLDVLEQVVSDTEHLVQHFPSQRSINIHDCASEGNTLIEGEGGIEANAIISSPTSTLPDTELLESKCSAAPFSMEETSLLSPTPSATKRRRLFNESSDRSPSPSYQPDVGDVNTWPASILSSPRCYICLSKFVSRYNCRRHLMTVHGLDRSQVDWKLVYEASVSKPELIKTSLNGKSELRRRKLIRRGISDKSRRRPARSTGGISKALEEDVPISTDILNPFHSLSIAVPFSPTADTNQDPCSEDIAEQQPYRCTECALQCMSHRSLSIHKLAAHGMHE